MKKYDIKVLVSMTASIRERLDAVAESEYKTLAQVVREAITAHLDSKTPCTCKQVKG